MSDLPLFDQPVPYAKGSDTSREAAEEMHLRAAKLRRKVLSAFRSAGRDGLTPDQVASLLRESVLSVRPRATELLQSGFLEKTGERRTNRSGLKANVLRSVK